MPTRLLPPHATANLSAFVVPHEPIALTLAILQPVVEAESRDIDSELADVADLDLEFLLDRPQPNGGVPPGHHPFSSDRILREGDLIKLPPSSMSRTRSVRVLLTEPVRQGVLTPSTRLIVSTTPYRPKPVAGLNGDTASEGSIPRTHLSAALEEFDPDAFLSGSLSMQLGVTQPGDLPDGGALGEELVGSWSSSSGSLTPRPRGDRPESPAARNRDLDENEDEVGMGGTRFNAVRFGAGLGRGRAGDEVCWVGVGGLGRAGIFEGDWVSRLS
jgi:peroxin-6